jgi:hypothetical protein
LAFRFALDLYLYNSLCSWQYSNCIIFYLIVKLPMHLNPSTTWSSKFWYPSLVGSFIVSQQVFWYPNDTRTITRWTNHLGNASVILGFDMRYIKFDNLMNKSLIFRTILTKVKFITASVAYLMLDPTCFVLRMPLDTFIHPHVLVKYHLEAFVALSWSSKICCQNQILRFAKPDSPVLTDLLQSFYYWTDSYIVVFFFATKATSLR